MKFVANKSCRKKGGNNMAIKVMSTTIITRNGYKGITFERKEGSGFFNYENPYQ
jgi:hypothetical protein